MPALPRVRYCRSTLPVHMAYHDLPTSCYWPMRQLRPARHYHTDYHSIPFPTQRSYTLYYPLRRLDVSPGKECWDYTKFLPCNPGWNCLGGQGLCYLPTRVLGGV
eukprot:205402-Rhodomonas_salina.4